MAAAKDITLTYWDLPGRAEVTRIALRVGGNAFNDVRMKKEDWPAKRAELGHGLPLFEIDGKEFSESLALARYAGKIANPPLYPKDDIAAMRCDEIMDICQDVLGKCPQGGTAEEKKAAREKYAAGALKGYFDLMSKRLGTQDYFTESISIADLVLQYAVFNLIRMGFFDHIPVDYVTGWPNLLAHETRVAEWVKANDKK